MSDQDLFVKVLLTVGLLVALFVVLGSLGYLVYQRNRRRHTPWSRRISLAVVLAGLVAFVAALTRIW